MATATQANNTTDPNQVQSDAVNPQQAAQAAKTATPPAPAALPTASAVSPASRATDSAPSNVAGALPTGGPVGAGTGGLAPSDPATNLPTVGAGNGGLMPSDPANVGTAVQPTSPAQLGNLPTASESLGTIQLNAQGQPTDMGDNGPAVSPSTIGTPVNPTSPAPLGATPPASTPTTPTVTNNSALSSLLAGNPANGAGTPSSVGASPTNPNNPLTSQTLSVGSLNDPLAVAEAEQQTFANATEPQYQAELRDALRTAAAGGAIGSGALNTSVGDITNARQNTLATNQQQELESALGLQNQNAYANLNQADQQQAFQNQQEQQGYQQALGTTQEQQSLNSQAFAQALSQLTAGESNNPAQLETTIAGIFGNDAAAAESALQGLTRGIGANSASSSSTQALQTALQNYINGQAKGGQTTTGTTGTTGGTGTDATGGWTANPDGSYTDPSGNVWTQDASGNWNTATGDQG